jgi:hypothetical protein
MCCNQPPRAPDSAQAPTRHNISTSSQYLTATVATTTMSFTIPISQVIEVIQDLASCLGDQDYLQSRYTACILPIAPHTSTIPRDTDNEPTPPVSFTMFVYTIAGRYTAQCSSFLTPFWPISGHCVLVNGRPSRDRVSLVVTRRVRTDPQYSGYHFADLQAP